MAMQNIWMHHWSLGGRGKGRKQRHFLEVHIGDLKSMWKWRGELTGQLATQVIDFMVKEGVNPDSIPNHLERCGLGWVADAAFEYEMRRGGDPYASGWGAILKKTVASYQGNRAGKTGNAASVVAALATGKRIRINT